MQNEERLHCPTCGYNLRGLPDGTCPECGMPFERAILSALEQPTVSPGSLRAFTIAWPFLYLIGVLPITALVFTLLSLKPGMVVFAIITTVICYPVCKDIARQSARIQRLNQIEAEPVSVIRLFFGYWSAEVVAIMLLVVGVNRVWMWL